MDTVQCRSVALAFRMSSSRKKIRRQPSMRARISPMLRFGLRSLSRSAQAARTSLLAEGDVAKSRSGCEKSRGRSVTMACVKDRAARSRFTSSVRVSRLPMTTSRLPMARASVMAWSRCSAGLDAGTMMASSCEECSVSDGMARSMRSSCVSCCRTSGERSDATYAVPRCGPGKGSERVICRASFDHW